jgi:hypothetical protein
MAELQRTRTTLLGIKATHQSEIKKKEKDIERMAEKWSKITEAQTKLMTIPSGMRCANVAVVDGSEIIGKGQGFLEVALEEAEKSQKYLTEENGALRNQVLTAVNEVQSILHQVGRQKTENEAAVRTIYFFTSVIAEIDVLSQYLLRSRHSSLYIRRGMPMINSTSYSLIFGNV